MFWWTTLLYTLPVTEKELMTQCDIVLVYIWDGIFCELKAKNCQKIKRLQPALKPPESTKITQLVPVVDPNAEEPDPKQPPQHISITQSTAAATTSTDDKNVTPQSASDLHAIEHTQLLPLAVGTTNELRTSAVIPESAEGEPLVVPTVELNESPQSSLPSIAVFLSKTSTIPFVRCDFEQIKKTVELKAQQNKSDENEDVGNQSAGPVSTSTKDNDNIKTSDNNHTVGGPSQTEVHTSKRKRTIIDYKKFL